MGLPLLLLLRFRAVARLQPKHPPPVATSCGFHNPPRLPRSHPRLRPIVVLHCLGGRCQRLGLRSNVPRSDIVQLPGVNRFFGLGPPDGLLLRLFSFRFLIVEGYPVDGAVSFVFWWAHGLSFPVDSSPSCWSISLLAPRLASTCIYFFGMAGVRLVPYQRDLG